MFQQERTKLFIFNSWNIWCITLFTVSSLSSFCAFAPPPPLILSGHALSHLFPLSNSHLKWQNEHRSLSTGLVYRFSLENKILIL